MKKMAPAGPRTWTWTRIVLTVLSVLSFIVDILATHAPQDGGFSAEVQSNSPS